MKLESVSVKEGRDAITKRNVERVIEYLCDADAKAISPDEEMFQLPVGAVHTWAQKMPL